MLWKCRQIWRRLKNAIIKRHLHGGQSKRYCSYRFIFRIILPLICTYCLITTWRFLQILDKEETVPTVSNLIETSPRSHWLVNTDVKYYTLSPDPSYHYEFRYRWSQNDSSNRLMLLLGGHKRQCIDWWTFSVGRRILSAIRSSNYSILSVCSPRATFDFNIPIEENQDVKWIYKSLQVWMNDVYYARYQRYPFLYLYAVSRGSHFAGLLCRVLPVQAQILYIYPGYLEGMTRRFAHDRDLKTRLELDPSFASWFYFKFCYMMTSDLCLFQANKISYFNPVPPTYFVHVLNDAKLNKSDYIKVISAIQNDSYDLGGSILNETASLKLHISSPPNATPTYMQENFHQWRHKPYASQLLYEHLVGFPKLPEQQNSEYKFQTFWCHRGDFRFFERYPLIMQTWTEQQQEEYRDYSNDIQTFHELLTEEFCGDLGGQHAMLSLDIMDALSWVSDIDSLRARLRVQDYLSRPLRIWMYKKENIVPERYQNHHQEANCSHNVYSNRMYSSESIIQEYFNDSSYTDDPLLADYFLIPHDLYCFIFFHQLFANFTDEQFKAHVSYYSRTYFEPLLNRVSYDFPYWRMTERSGANHVLAFVGGRNMGVLDDHLQRRLVNVIQLGPTGIRQDLLPSKAPELYLHRNLSTIYRHGYDIVIPPFTPTEAIQPNTSTDWYKTKTQLFFFAGSVNHSLSPKSARNSLNAIFRNYSTPIKIEKKEFHAITVVNGHVSPRDYLHSIMSSVFFLCPEGYSPWSPRIYEAINVGSIPFILADGIVLPFERFIPWHSFSFKLTVNNMISLFEFVIANSTSRFEERVLKKRRYAQRYSYAFRWLSIDNRRKQNPALFIPESDVTANVFHFIYRELKCRRLEQLFGAAPDVFSSVSIGARQQVCTTYSHICPCITRKPIAFDQYNYEEPNSLERTTLLPTKAFTSKELLKTTISKTFSLNDSAVILVELMKKLDLLLAASKTR